MQSLLACSETGRYVPTLCEELTTYRRARKVLLVPSGIQGPGKLYFLVRRYAAHNGALRLSVNGHAFEYPAAARETQEWPHWAEIPLPAHALRSGLNTIEMWADSPAQDAWSLAIEGGHRDPQSFLSTDGGVTWQNERMGLHFVERGEYLVRLRTVGKDSNPPPPKFAWENPSTPRLRELRDIIPLEIQGRADPWSRARALASWVSVQWPYFNGSSEAAIYTPWDPWTILAWKEGVRPHGQPCRAIRMCVHYAVVFISACSACGIPARAVIGTSALSGGEGHFVSEVWSEKFGQWCMVDPNADVTFIENGRPLGAAELFGYGANLRGLADIGPGASFHQSSLGHFFDQYLDGAPMLRLTGIWRRNDFVSHPEFTPAWHGKGAYSETEIVWRDRNRHEGELEMFPYVVGDAYFSEPPPTQWLGRS